MKEEITERLERYRKGLPPSPPRRKIPGVLVLINVILLGVFLFIYKKSPVREYSTTAVEYDNVNYSITIAKNENKGMHVVSVKLKSNSPSAREFRYKQSVMQVLFQSEEQVIYRTEIGRGNTRILLKPDESIMLEQTVDDIVLKDYIDNHPQLIVPRRKTNLFSETQYLPLTAVIKINTGNPVTLRMGIKYKVD